MRAGGGGRWDSEIRRKREIVGVSRRLPKPKVNDVGKHGGGKAQNRFLTDSRYWPSDWWCRYNITCMATINIHTN